MRIVEGASSKNTDRKVEAGSGTVKQWTIGEPLPGLEAADQGDQVPLQDARADRPALQETFDPAAYDHDMDGLNKTGPADSEDLRQVREHNLLEDLQLSQEPQDS